MAFCYGLRLVDPHLKLLISGLADVSLHQVAIWMIALN